MTHAVSAHLQTVLGHLYINPLEKCNLKCKVCYTRKTNPILSNKEILSFVARYGKVYRLETVTFCGGEVLALTSFPELVNTLTDQGKFIRIITNGTIDTLSQFRKPNSVNVIVSLDGLPPYHDANRGTGNFAKSLQFLKHAESLGFHTDVFSILTRQNLPDIDAFEKYLRDSLDSMPTITYHPRKPPLYLQTHPISNIVGETEGFDFLTREEMLTVMKTRNVFPPKDLGCYQITVASDGNAYGCCEGTVPIGTMNDKIETLVDALRARIEVWEKTNDNATCLGCSQPEFMCGIKQYLVEMNLHKN